MMRPDGHEQDPFESARRKPHPHQRPDSGPTPQAEPSNTSEHDIAHEQRLRAALELESGDPAQARRAAAGCAQCFDELQRFDAVRRLLDEAGASQARTLQRAQRALREGEPAPGEELVAPLLRARLATLRPRRTRLRRLAPLVWAAAAAASLLWLVRSWFPRSEPTGRGVLLGEHGERGLEPRGDVREYAPFRWNLPLPPGGAYFLRVWDADQPSRELLRLERIEEAELWIDPAQLATWPDSITWEVQARDATGSDAGVRRVSARRVR